MLKRVREALHRRVALTRINTERLKILMEKLLS